MPISLSSDRSESLDVLITVGGLVKRARLLSSDTVLPNFGFAEKISKWSYFQRFEPLVDCSEV